MKRLIWRAALLATLYYPWMYLYFLLGFAVMYSPAYIYMPVLWGFIGLYGALSFCLLKGTITQRVITAALIPVPVLCYFFLYDLQATNDFNRALQWAWVWPIHAAGTLCAALYSKFRDNRAKNQNLPADSLASRD